jgi:predicted phage terminase large subunit-like protein
MDGINTQMTENQRLLSAMMAEGQKGDLSAYQDALRVIKEIEHDGMSVIRDSKYRVIARNYDENNFAYAHQNCQILREYLSQFEPETDDDGEKLLRLYRDTLQFDAPYDFDCFCRYIEWDREEDKKFYMPRRKQLLPLAQALQRLEERKIKLLCISMPPGTGKTTIAEFFMAWTGGRHPELSNIIGSHSNSFLRGVYDEIMRIVGKHSEYLWQRVFPETRLVGTNAKDLMLDLGSRKRFGTFELSSIGSGNAGKIRASNVLYVDDLVDGIETALNKDRLDKIWQQYNTDYRQRMIGNAACLVIATRWSVHDPIGRLEDIYENDPQAEFIVCPALDENDESNFDYPFGLGFTTEFYREQRELMDAPSFKALYMNEPIEREGQLYPPDMLQRYFELPDGEPDAIIGVCDTKTTGSDFCVMPIVFQYGNKFYIEDCLCENYAPNVVEANLVSKIEQWNPHMIRFESNVAGGKLASDIQQAVKARGCRTKIETKWTQQNKETKILVEAHWVMEHCIFKDDTVLHGDEWREYRKMMQMLTSYSLEGKNKHDDVPDAFAQLSQYIQGFYGNKVEIVKRVF